MGGTLDFGAGVNVTSPPGAWYIVKYAWDGTALKAAAYGGDDGGNSEICKNLDVSRYDGFIYAIGEQGGR